MQYNHASEFNNFNDDLLVAELNEQACSDEARQRFYDNLRKLEQEAKKGRERICNDSI